MPTFDVHKVTYRDDDGVEHNAMAYLMADGDLACFSRYGHWTSECAPIACLLFEMLCWNGCEDTVDCLDGCMGNVVNEHDDVEHHIREYAGIVGANPADYLER